MCARVCVRVCVCIIHIAAARHTTRGLPRVRALDPVHQLQAKQRIISIGPPLPPPSHFILLYNIYKSCLILFPFFYFYFYFFSLSPRSPLYSFLSTTTSRPGGGQKVLKALRLCPSPVYSAAIPICAYVLDCSSVQDCKTCK